MKTLRKLKQFAANAGLVTLAAGFGLLGILSFCVKNGAEVNNLASDRQLSTIVSSIDLLIAATFLLYATLYWRRTPEIVEQSGGSSNSGSGRILEHGSSIAEPN